MQGSVLLTIGYHQLEGQTVVLKKPLAVLSKTKALDDAEMEGIGNIGGEESSITYKVVGVVKEKYLFKARPRPLITKPEGCKA
jgi:chromosome transmission fidelity protein 8